MCLHQYAGHLQSPCSGHRVFCMNSLLPRFLFIRCSGSVPVKTVFSSRRAGFNKQPVCKMCVLTWPQHEAKHGQWGAHSQQLAWPPQSPAVPVQCSHLHSTHSKGLAPKSSLGCTNTSVLLQLLSFSHFHVRCTDLTAGSAPGCLGPAATSAGPPQPPLGPATTGMWRCWNLSPPESIIAGTCPKQPAAAGTSLC